MSKIPPHRNIVSLLGICQEPFCILTEFLDGGCLFDYLRKPIELKLSTLMKFVRDICEGLNHLHNHNIVHR